MNRAHRIPSGANPRWDPASTKRVSPVTCRDWREARKAAAEGRIHECQTPVFLWMTTAADGGATLVADVAPEAPTVKGFVAVLRGVVAGRPAAEVAEIPEDLVERIGLADVLGMLRARGLRAITARIKRGFAAGA